MQQRSLSSLSTPPTPPHPLPSSPSHPPPPSPPPLSTNYVDAIDDVSDFREMDSALGSCGLEATEKVDLYGVVAAMLYLGNVALGPGAGSETIAVSEASLPDLRMAEKLLGIGDISELLVEKVNSISQPTALALPPLPALSKHITTLPLPPPPPPPPPPPLVRWSSRRGVTTCITSLSTSTPPPTSATPS